MNLASKVSRCGTLSARNVLLPNSCVFDLATRAPGADQSVNQATSDVKFLIDEAVRSQIGSYPNKMVGPRDLDGSDATRSRGIKKGRHKCVPPFVFN